MFTGIVEALGTVVSVTPNQNNIDFTVRSSISHELKVDQSVAHNGVCLTVTAINGDIHTVTAVQETLNRTDLGTWKTGSEVNLERCMPANGRFDGHIVQGHVDTTAVCESVSDENGSWKYWFSYKSDQVTVEKGSITVNGVSLTVVDSEANRFSVAIIPYTKSHTTFNTLKAGDTVNLEFDIVGKYVARLLNIQP